VDRDLRLDFGVHEEAAWLSRVSAEQPAASCDGPETSCGVDAPATRPPT
jgi:hypothetical protein